MYTTCLFSLLVYNVQDSPEIQAKWWSFLEKQPMFWHEPDIWHVAHYYHSYLIKLQSELKIRLAVKWKFNKRAQAKKQHIHPPTIIAGYNLQEQPCFPGSEWLIKLEMVATGNKPHPPGRAPISSLLLAEFTVISLDLLIAAPQKLALAHSSHLRFCTQASQRRTKQNIVSAMT